MLAGPGTTPAEQPPIPGEGPASPPPIEILETNLSAREPEEAVHSSADVDAEGAAIHILSTDAGLQTTMAAAANGDYAVTAVADWQQLVAAVEAGDARILILDADAIKGRIEWRIARLKAAADWSVIMIAADRDRAPFLMELLWQHRIHRLVIKPVGQGVARILMESAVARYCQLRDDPDLRDAKAESGSTKLAARLARFRPRNPLLIAAYASIAVAIAIMIRVVFVPALTSDTPSPTAADDPPNAAVGTVAEPVPEPAAEPEVPFADEIQERLRLAREAASQGWLTGPQGASALDHYLGVLEYDPNHDEATTRVAALLDGLFGQAEAELLADTPDLAALTLDRIRRVRPDHSRLLFLERQLDIVRERVADEPLLSDLDLESPMPVVAAVPALSELDSLLTVADVRLQNGQLLLPEGDSAFDYLRRAEAISIDDPIVVETRLELAGALSVNAQDTFDAGDIAAAERYIMAARELGAEEEPLLSIESAIAALRAEAAAEAEAARLAGFMASAEERLEQGQFVEPEGDSAFFYLSTLRSEDSGYPNLDAAWQRMADDIAANVAAAIGAADWEAAENWLVALDLVADDPEAAGAELRAELEFARRREAFLSVPVAPRELVLLESTPLVYPARAQAGSVEGWVDLQYVVGFDGLVREVTVTGAEPVGIFEQAAIDAVSTYRYEPFELDGRAYERLLSMRIRFALQ